MKDKELNHRTIHPKKHGEKLLTLLRDYISNDKHILSVIVKLLGKRSYTSVRENLQEFSELLVSIIKKAYSARNSEDGPELLGPYLISLIIGNILNFKVKNTIATSEPILGGRLTNNRYKTLKTHNLRKSLHANRTRRLLSNKHTLQAKKSNNNNNSNDTMYSPFQYDIITSQLFVSSVPGKINVFYKYYLHTLENKEDIFIKLLNMKLENHRTLASIQKLLEHKKYTELDTFLIKHADKHVISDAKRVLNALSGAMISGYYFAFTEDNDRYEFLFNLFNNIPETENDVEELANMFYKSKLGNNPFITSTSINYTKNFSSSKSNSINANSSDPSTLAHLPPSPRATSMEQNVYPL
jgi:hypothetical protein